MDDKTWEITIKVRVTTMSGWMPVRDDVEDWLEDGGLQLTDVVSCEEVKS